MFIVCSDVSGHPGRAAARRVGSSAEAPAVDDGDVPMCCLCSCVAAELDLVKRDFRTEVVRVDGAGRQGLDSIRTQQIQ
jgi:hypothetical protein